RRLGERARVLLDGGVAVELERIEVAAVRADLLLVLVQDLRLGLDLEMAQLLFETRHRARELAEIEIERAELLLQAGARDARLARDVEKLIEKIGVDARHLDALARLHRLAPGRDRLRRREALLSLVVRELLVHAGEPGIAHRPGARRLREGSQTRGKNRCARR